MNRVLVVDDEQSVRTAVGAVLRHCGWEVTLAADGPECLEILRGGFRGVVLMDVVMPGLNGWETIRALVSERLQEQVLICMLTGEPASKADSQGVEQFVFDYLPKPFDNSTLLQMVESAAVLLES